MTNFIFASEPWLWVIPLWMILAVALWFLSGWMAQRRLARFGSSQILLSLGLLSRRRPHLAGFCLANLVLILGLLALARPLTGPKPGTMERSGVDLVIVLDVSKSMLVEDVKPSRLGAIKKELRKWLADYPENGTGLVLFAGDAFVVAPLTFDHEALDYVLAESGPKSISVGGSNLPAAIETAAELLKKDRESPRVMMIISDGENLEGDAAMAARKAFAEDQITILTVGVGTLQGGQVPARDYTYTEDPAVEKNPAKGYVRNEYGLFVQSRLDERSLRSIAEAAGGRYYLFKPDTDSFQNLRNQSLLPLARKGRARNIDVADYQEWFQVPLGGAILVMVAGSLIHLLRRKNRAVAPGVKVVQPENLSALPTLK